MHMAAYLDSLTGRLTDAITEIIQELDGISADTAAFVAPARHLLAGGKRSRAQLAALGFTCARPDSPLDTPVLLLAGSALELFQAAALVHDDLIDDAETRRGLPAAHRHFAAAHEGRNRRGLPDTFGKNVAVLLGDLLLTLSFREMTRAVRLAGDSAARALDIWNEMTAEVAIGQYLDIEAATLELPAAGDDAGHEHAIERAMVVLRHKSAHYSVAHPLALGAALAGAPEDLFVGLAAIGEPLGEAFQLRDDDLGIFGDPARTGKPAGDDLLEGKRTPLVLLGLARTTGADRDTILAALGNRGLTPAETEKVRSILLGCGAVEAHEQLIKARRRKALEAVEALLDPPTPAAISPAAGAQLRAVVESLTRRDR